MARGTLEQLAVSLVNKGLIVVMFFLLYLLLYLLFKDCPALRAISVVKLALQATKFQKNTRTHCRNTWHKKTAMKDG